MRDNLTASYVSGVGRWCEEVIKPYVRRPGRKRVADLWSVQQPIGIGVIRIEHQLDGAPPDFAAAQPHQRAQAIRQLAKIKEISGRQRVEVAGQHVETVLMARNTRKKRPQLDHAMAFGPRRIQRAEVHAENPQLSGSRLDVEKSMPREPGMVPLERSD